MAKAKMAATGKAGVKNAPSKKAAGKTAAAKKASSNKTVATAASVAAFVDAIDDPLRKRDAGTLLTLMKSITGKQPKMWGGSIVGFGDYHYKYESGREGDFFRVGFSPRKANMTVYIMSGFSAYDDLLAALGPCKTGKSCLYLTDLEKNDLAVLTRMIKASLAYMDEKYGSDA